MYTTCMRLVSNVKTMGYFNSLGSTALEVGSIKVNTINLARIAYESANEEETFTVAVPTSMAVTTPCLSREMIFVS